MSAPESWYVTRTMRALELLAFTPASAAEVAHELQVHPRTARRMLSRLVVEGYLHRTEGEQLYQPTMRIVALAGQIVHRSELAVTAAPHVRRLSERSGAVAHLFVPSYDSVLCLAHAEGDAGEAVEPLLRELVPCHCTAAGKALLAWRHRWRHDVLSRPLERHTDRTIVEATVVEEECTRVRARGYAVEDGEHGEEVRAVAAPVFDESGEAVGALTISGPSSSLPDLEALGPGMVEAATELSADLGFHLDEAPRSGRALRLA
jgi:DNA-binding IclR family transcriptional regulator